MKRTPAHLRLVSTREAGASLMPVSAPQTSITNEKSEDMPRRKLPVIPENIAGRMVALALSFPCLRALEGVVPFAPMRLADFFHVAARYPALAQAGIVSVDPANANIIGALSFVLAELDRLVPHPIGLIQEAVKAFSPAVLADMDEEHREAVIAWLRAPTPSSLTAAE